MDFLDPQKERRVRMALFVGYALVAIAIGIATLILYYWSYGYTIDRKGNVLQHGFVFVSSQPTGGNIYLNGKLNRTQTNTKLNLSTGTYDVNVTKTGYRPWTHWVSVLGSDVQRFDYLQLFPTTLTTNTVGTHSGVAVIASQSPDKRWIAIMEASKQGTFTLYDLKNPTKPLATSLIIPADRYTPGDGAQTWNALDWADDNSHMLVEHTFTVNGAVTKEYLMIDFSQIDQTVNLTKTLALPAAEQLSLFNNKFDQFYAYNRDTKQLRSFTASGELPMKFSNVIAFKTYASNTLLYVSDYLPSGKQTPGIRNVLFANGATTTLLRQFSTPLPKNYLLDVAQYGGDWYVVCGETPGQGVFIYKNPQSQGPFAAGESAKAWRLLTMRDPTFVKFSANTRFVLIENAQQISIYDAENIESHAYVLNHSLDAPQTHVAWEDGYRITYVSGNKLIVTDYDNTNEQQLQSMAPQYPPFFTANGALVYSVAVGSDTQTRLTMTPLTLQ